MSFTLQSHLSEVLWVMLIRVLSLSLKENILRLWHFFHIIFISFYSICKWLITFILKVRFYRERASVIGSSLNDCNGQSWANLKSAAMSFPWVVHVGQEPKILDHPLLLSQDVSREELDGKWSSWNTIWCPHGTKGQKIKFLWHFTGPLYLLPSCRNVIASLFLLSVLIFYLMVLFFLYELFNSVRYTE